MAQMVKRRQHAGTCLSTPRAVPNYRDYVIALLKPNADNAKISDTRILHYRGFNTQFRA